MSDAPKEFTESEYAELSFQAPSLLALVQNQSVSHVQHEDLCRRAREELASLFHFIVQERPCGLCAHPIDAKETRRDAPATRVVKYNGVSFLVCDDHFLKGAERAVKAIERVARTMAGVHVHL